MKQPRQKTRAELSVYLFGKGIEIGALQKSLDLSNSSVQSVKYVDRMPTAELRKHYPELAELTLIEPDVVDDAQILKNFSDESLDFIIANHLIEHMENPIQAIETWLRKLKPGGIIYMAMPDKRFTFDKKRPLTTFKHLLDDYRLPRSKRKSEDKKHFKEWVYLTEKRTGKDAQQRLKHLLDINYSIHFHVWTSTTFHKFLTSLQEKLDFPFEILDYSDPLPEGNEGIFVLKKHGSPPNAQNPSLIERVKSFLAGN
jgi:predicted SAM-dependent methyltransferase